MNTPNDRAVHVLNDLIETTLDSAHGYRRAAEGADNPEFMPEDGEGFHDDYVSNVYNPEREKFLAALPSDELRERYSALLGDDGPDREEWSIKAAERENGQTQSWALQTLGDPYSDEEIAKAADDVAGKTELDAVVAYLQGLGKHAPRGG